MRVLEIINGTIVDGNGLRTSIYFAGCKHCCKGCHNPESWDINGGKVMSVNEIFKIVEKNKFNVTYSGGDPLYQNIDELIDLSKKIHSLNLDIWLYTGFTFEEIKNNDIYKNILDNIDVLVDGPFIESEKDLNLSFRGSRNQRILKKTNNSFTDISLECDLKNNQIKTKVSGN